MQTVQYDPKKVEKEVKDIEKQLSEELVDGVIEEFKDEFDRQLDAITGKLRDLQENLNNSAIIADEVFNGRLKEFHNKLKQQETMLDTFSKESENTLSEAAKALHTDLEKRNTLLEGYFENLEHTVNESFIRKIHQNIEENNTIISQISKRTDESMDVFNEKILTIRSDINTEITNVQQELDAIAKDIYRFKLKNDISSVFSIILIIVVILLQIFF